MGIRRSVSSVSQRQGGMRPILRFRPSVLLLVKWDSASHPLWRERMQPWALEGAPQRVSRPAHLPSEPRSPRTRGVVSKSNRSIFTSQSVSASSSRFTIPVLGAQHLPPLVRPSPMSPGPTHTVGSRGHFMSATCMRWGCPSVSSAGPAR